MESIPNFLEVAQRRPIAPLIRHGKEFWRQAVHDQETFGLSLSQFCLERGFAKATFFQWRKALKQQVKSALPASQPETQPLPGFRAVTRTQCSVGLVPTCGVLLAATEVMASYGDSERS